MYSRLEPPTSWRGEQRFRTQTFTDFRNRQIYSDLVEIYNKTFAGMTFAGMKCFDIWWKITREKHRVAIIGPRRQLAYYASTTLKMSLPLHLSFQPVWLSFIGVSMYIIKPDGSGVITDLRSL